MSKLDDILYPLHIGGDVISTVNKRDIKTLFKELIGEDIEPPTGPRQAGKTYAYVANNIKKELRQKVDEL